MMNCSVGKGGDFSQGGGVVERGQGAGGVSVRVGVGSIFSLGGAKFPSSLLLRFDEVLTNNGTIGSGSRKRGLSLTPASSSDTPPPLAILSMKNRPPATCSDASYPVGHSLGHPPFSGTLSGTFRGHFGPEGPERLL